MSTDQSTVAGEDRETVRRAMYIMIVWTLAVIVAGIVLVVLRDPFAAIFALAALGL